MNVPLSSLVTAWLDAQPVSERERGVAQLEQVTQLVAVDPTVRRYLLAPFVSAQEKVTLLKQAGCTESCAQLLGYLARHGWFVVLPRLVRLAKTQLLRQRNHCEATVVSVIALSERERTRLREVLEKKVNSEVILHEEIDPTILGGLVVEMQGERTDASLRGKLAALRAAVQFAQA